MSSNPRMLAGENIPMLALLLRKYPSFPPFAGIKFSILPHSVSTPDVKVLSVDASDGEHIPEFVKTAHENVSFVDYIPQFDKI